MSKFVKAERKKVKLKIGMMGPSGSGKTYSSLALATGMGSRIAVIDTEKGSASLYGDRFDFETLYIDPPYTIDKYIEAMRAAESEGFDVVVVDSLSHAWAGEGGILDKKTKMDARGGNSFTNWGQLTPEQERLVSTILNLDIHLIATMRSKQEYVLEENAKGKQAPKKVGMAPVQRDGMEYEFTTVFEVAMDHNASASKDRTGLFDGQYIKIEKSTGETFMKWLSSGKAEVKPDVPSPKEIEELFELQAKLKVPVGVVKLWLSEIGIASSRDLNRAQYGFLAEKMMAFKPSISDDDIAF